MRWNVRNAAGGEPAGSEGGRDRKERLGGEEEDGEEGPERLLLVQR